jgi:hypothetical protein
VSSDERLREEKASFGKIWAAILISSEPMAGMVLRIWISAWLLTQMVTVANHI